MSHIASKHAYTSYLSCLRQFRPRMFSPEVTRMSPNSRKVRKSMSEKNKDKCEKSEKNDVYENENIEKTECTGSGTLRE